MVLTITTPRCLEFGDGSAAIAVRAIRGAFTLIEILVCVAVIALLIGLALPALAGARSRAQSTRCMAALHDFHTLHVTYADQANKGRYANALEPGTVVAQWTMGSTLWLTSETLDQTRFCMGPFAAAGWVERGLEDARYSCPAAVRNISAGAAETNPQILPHRSFWYSAAIFTSADLWDPIHPERRDAPDSWRQTVGMHEVQFPDRKVLLFESGDHHRSGLYLGQFGLGHGRTNVVCCDGHVVTVDPYAGVAPLKVPWPVYPGVIPFAGAMPFSSAPFGFRGRDW